MAYDTDLADRIRQLMDDTAGVTEKKMFGGLAFLVNGNMAIAASGQGGLLARVAPSQADELLASPGVQVMEVRGRPMAGWLRVSAESVDTDTRLAVWIKRGVAVAGALPPKG